MDTALHFSGGKDSLACLYLMQEEWDSMYVVWVNTGAAHPDVLEYMKRWKKRLPHFVEIKTNQPKNIEEFGWPADAVPVENSVLGKQISGGDGPLIQSCLECCARNIWFPLHEATVNLGVKYVVKGQRISDARKSTSRNGTQVGDITYLMPIEDWSEEEVFSYLKKVNADMPECYARGEKTGRDCWDCTGYLDDNHARIDNLPEDKKATVRGRIEKIRDAINGSALSSWS